MTNGQECPSERKRAFCQDHGCRPLLSVLPSDLVLSDLLIAKRKRASKGVTERKRRHERRDCRERRTTCLALDRAERKRSVRAEVPDCQGSSAFRFNVMICCEGTPKRSGKRSRKAEREGVNFFFQGEGATKTSFQIQFIKAGKDKNLNFGLGAGGGLFFYFQGKIFAWLFYRKAMRSRWAKQVKNSVCGVGYSMTY